MSNNYQNDWDDDDFDLEEDEAPARGNDLVKQLRKADRAKEKRIKEMEAELQSLRSLQRETNVSRVLESEGINPKIAKFIPAEVQEADAIKAWLDENAELFGFRPEPVPMPTQGVSDEDINAWRNMTDVLEDALPYGQADSQWDMVSQAQSQEDLLRMIYGAEQ